MAAGLDLDRLTRDALEFDRLLEWVASFASTSAGAARIVASAPAAELDEVQRELRIVEGVRRRLVRFGRLVPAGLPDPGAICDALAIEGFVPEPAALRELARLLEAAAVARAAATAETTDAEVRGEIDPIADLRGLVRPILVGVDGEGALLDAASPDLARIRSTRGRTESRLKLQLRSLLHDPGAAAQIRDDFITRRNGRYVIPVRTDAPRPLPGIVHARSSSGATRFVEPLESVEMNNDLVQLADDERDEIVRILSGWSAAFRARLDEIRATVAALTRLDTLQARALFAEATGSAETRITEHGPLRLEGVRHPLLERHLRESGEEIVPLDLTLDPPHGVLIISGPNTGGKTVALKTIGLAVLMAQSGIPVPAAAASLPLYGQLRADIGDHQSIDADLSTFSAHLRSVRRALEDRRPPSLILFDEVGTGTEPGEGAALGQALLEELLEPGITVIATTHLGALKTWAISVDGANCAAMEFDRETLRPTFRILPGAAGASAGLDSAARLGVPATIVERARALLDPGAAESEGQLARLRELVGDRERALAAVETEREALTRERETQALAASESQRDWRERARAALDEALDAWRVDARALLDRARAAGEDEARRVRSELERAERRARDSIERAARPIVDPVAAAADRPLDAIPVIGAIVRVASLGREGEVVGSRGGTIDVRLGGVVFSVPLGDLRHPAADRGGRSRPRAGSRVRIDGPDGGGRAQHELNLIGRRVEPSLDLLDKFLDDAILAGAHEIRVVHGHGTGRLRSAVRSFLREHRQVARVESAGPGRGGEGATIVSLRE